MTDELLIQREIHRVLARLQRMIREKGFTQLEIQRRLGWGRSYISQLVTGQKKLRLDQVLAILSVIGVTPHEFFLRLYAPGKECRRPPQEGDPAGNVGKNSGGSWVSPRPATH